MRMCRVPDTTVRQIVPRHGTAYLPSRRLQRHSLNLRHVVVKNSLHAAIIPFDRYACPIRFGDGAKIVCRGSPANAFANGEQSGLIAVHRFVFLQPHANAFQ
jgi:hypothetical protein